MHKDLSETLYTEDEIKSAVKYIANEINADHKGKDLTLMIILSGSMMFAMDLIRQLPDVNVIVDTMKVSSYDGTQSGALTIKSDYWTDIKGKDILIIEDIIDTGQTMSTLVDLLKDEGAKTVEVATLLSKLPSRQMDNYTINYLGYQVEDKFVVGYGLDYNEKYRNLPYIGVLKEEVYS